MAKRRFGLGLGEERWDLISFDRRPAGDVYMAMGGPTGLHVSFHASGVTHVRDILGLDSPLLQPTPEEAVESVRELVYEPAHSEDVLVFTEPAGLDVPAMADGKHVILDAERLLAPFDRPVVEVNVCDLPRFLQSMEATKAVVMDPTAKKMVFIDGTGHELTSLALPQDAKEGIDLLRGTPVGRKLMEPLFEGLQNIERAPAKPNKPFPRMTPGFAEKLDELLRERLDKLQVTRFEPKQSKG